MMYKNAVRTLKKNPRAALYSLISTITAVITAYILGMGGGIWSIVGAAIAAIIVDTGRTVALQEMAGKKDIHRVMRRICVDLGFASLAALLIVVLPLTQAFAVSIGNYHAATVIGFLWYFLAAVFILFLVELFRMGYLVAVQGKTLEEALIESVRAFRRDKWSEVKRTVLYWAPVSIWVIINAAVAATGSTTLAILGIVIMGAVIIPFMEATYIVVNREE